MKLIEAEKKLREALRSLKEANFHSAQSNPILSVLICQSMAEVRTASEKIGITISAL